VAGTVILNAAVALFSGKADFVQHRPPAGIAVKRLKGRFDFQPEHFDFVRPEGFLQLFEGQFRHQTLDFLSGQSHTIAHTPRHGQSF
jgi:hypothetical protein